MSTHWFRRAWTGERVADGVRIEVDASGTITASESGVRDPQDDWTVHDGLALPGAVNAHSHAFHRLLRGRTHGDGGTFWTWRSVMYRAAAQLDPEIYRAVATAVYAEMVTAGYTAVGEFHYVHHRPDGTPYPDHAMERALAQAAVDAGIRLVLLDTAYLTGGIGADGPQPPGEEQQRFTDGDIESYLERHTALRQVLAGVSDRVTVGAAIHSVRAVPEAAIARFASLDGPVHVHLSEQPAENAACREAYGVTPTGLLERTGVLPTLGPRLSAVHATHLTEADVAALGGAGASVVMCPTTEADLADGIGPARALADAGASVALGSDQHVVLDPLLEVRGLEAGERLGSGERGRFAPGDLVAALTTGGSRSLGLPAGLVPGGPLDVVVVDDASVRTIGSVDEQLVLAATAQDAREVLVAGRVVARDGAHTALGDVAALYRTAYSLLDL
ncbi:formimidoylglutamate deiminase [Brevibacterium litoralis]|uniref:formimidoylglutamate deiminase n=1 Tax=Brevibacterium litoralis TaxID=3138935 RepID=UPI0032EBA1DB